MTAEDNHTESNVSAFTANLTGLLRAVDLCLQEQLVLPTLALIYTGIDVVSALERTDTDRVQDHFIRWTGQYLIPHLDTHITALDIYGARCGVLHSFSPTSNLSRGKKARPIAYAWGNANVREIRAAARRLNADMPALHLTALAKAFRLAIVDWIDDITTDSARAAVVETRSAGQWFAQLTKEQLAGFNQLPRKGFRTRPKR